MASYCAFCHWIMFGNELEEEPDFDVKTIFDDLEPGQQEVVGLCESCGITTVVKTKEDPNTIYCYIYGSDKLYKYADLNFNGEPDDNS